MLSLSSYTGLTEKHYESEELRRSVDDAEDYWVVAPGDVVLNPMWIFKGAVAPSLLDLEGTVSPAYVVLRPHAWHDPRFIAYQLKSASMLQWYAAEARGETTYDRAVKWDALRSVSIAAPPLADQRAIADFLDRECARIDELRRELEGTYQSLAQSLKETKARRLVQVSETAVAALGTTPRLRHVLVLNNGGAWGADKPGDDLISFRVWRSTEIDVLGRWRPGREAAVRFLNTRERSATALLPGDLVVTKSSGSQAHIGKTALVTAAQAGNGFSNFMQRLRVDEKTDPRFVWHLLNSRLTMEHFDRVATTTSGLRNVSGGLLRDVPLPTRDLRLQQEVADEFDRLDAVYSAPLDDLISLSETLTEYRDALITEAVTGQLDVSTMNESRMDESRAAVAEGADPEVVA